MARRMRFGVTLPQIKRSWSEARAAAVEFDGLGYDSLWVCDHVHGVPMPNVPILEAWSELAAVAAITEHAELGALVTPPFFRNPALLAKQIATIDRVAGGRVIAGLGAGWNAPEFQGYGCAFPPIRERMQALEETVEILRLLWTEERASYRGKHFSLDKAFCEPKPVRRPPVLIGGGGERVLLRIAARHADLWNNLAVFQGQLEKKIEVLRRHCDEVGRDFDAIEVSQQCVVVIASDEAGAREALERAQKIYGGHMGSAIAEHGIWGTPERVIDGVERHHSLGCTKLVIEFFGRDTREPARLFADKVIPAFR